MMKRAGRRKGYALFFVMLLAFFLTVLLGVAVTHVGYSSDVVNAYVRRIEARSDLISMTNLSVRWLSEKLKTGTRPRASVAERNERLTSAAPLRIFFSNNAKGGEVEVYDLDYNPENLAEPVIDPLLLPASFPCAYMIRATAVKNNMAPIMMESAYEVLPVVDSDGEVVYVLEDKPIYRKESFLQRAM